MGLTIYANTLFKLFPFRPHRSGAGSFVNEQFLFIGMRLCLTCLFSVPHLELGEKLVEAGKLIIEQAGTPDNEVWIESILRRCSGKSIGYDVMEMLADVRALIGAWVRRPTWAGDPKKECRFTKNTMGYQSST